jgi:hypothetical protein
MNTHFTHRSQIFIPSVRWRCRGRFAALALSFLAAGVLMGAAQPVLAQETANADLSEEYNVKAVFLYTFGRFIDWPPEVFAKRTAPFVIGVLDKDPFGGTLDQIAKLRKIDGRPIVIRRFRSLNEYRPCQILFIPKTTPPDVQTAVINKLGTQPVLLVGEESTFTRQGGTLNFYLNQDSIRFEINAETVKRQHLSIDAKMLQLATIVTGEKQKRK